MIPSDQFSQIRWLTCRNATGMVPPALYGLVSAATGGSLSPGAYSYFVTALNGAGETLPGSEASITIPDGAGSTNTITLSWAAVIGATSYNVYGRTQDSTVLLANVAGLIWTDTGAASIGGGPPTIDNTGTTGQSIPGFGACSVLGVDVAGTFYLGIPITSNGIGYLFAQAEGIAAGLYGSCTGDAPMLALYEVADGTPAAGDIWGVQAGSFALRKGQSGYLIHGREDGGRAMVEPDCCTSTSNPTTTPPCAGDCFFTWGASSKVWSLITPACTGDTVARPCVCTYPRYCGTEDGECTFTNCGKVAGYPPPCGQTTTTPGCNTATYCPGFRCVLIFQAGAFAVKSSGCEPTCYCPVDAYNVAYQQSIAAGGAVAPENYETTVCCGGTPPSLCDIPCETGLCYWDADGSGGWTLDVARTHCPDGCPCCSPPPYSSSDPGCETATTPCMTNRTTTTTTTSTTTTTPFVCGDCTWEGDGVLWELTGPNCTIASGCGCSAPTLTPTAGTFAVTQCGTTTTTSSTSSTTTTTPGPCPTTTTPGGATCGQCVFESQFTGSYSWRLAYAGCTGSCTCSQPVTDPAFNCNTPAVTNCVLVPTTTSTTTTSTSTTSTTTTTTTPGPCSIGACNWAWNQPNLLWEFTGSTCTTGCFCTTPPPFAGSFNGQTVSTGCQQTTCGACQYTASSGSAWGLTPTFGCTGGCTCQIPGRLPTHMGEIIQTACA